MSCSCLFPVLLSFMPTDFLPNPMYSNHVIIQPISVCSSQLSIYVSYIQDSVITLCHLMRIRIPCELCVGTLVSRQVFEKCREGPNYEGNPAINSVDSRVSINS